MNKFFPRLKVKDLCILGLLTAITVVLGVFCTFRVGEAIKIPMKFISIFITAALYGPFYGGITAVVGDIFNCLLAPSGAFLPQITAVEFLNGFIFGIFFFKSGISRRNYIIRALLCSIALFAIDMFLTSWLLIGVGIFPAFGVAFTVRIVAGIIKFSLHILIVLALKNLTESLVGLKNE